MYPDPSLVIHSIAAPVLFWTWHCVVCIFFHFVDFLAKPQNLISLTLEWTLVLELLMSYWPRSFTSALALTSLITQFIGEMRQLMRTWHTCSSPCCDAFIVRSTPVDSQHWQDIAVSDLLRCPVCIFTSQLLVAYL